MSRTSPQYAVRTVNCPCGVTITKRMPPRQKTCSAYCYQRSPHPEKRKYVLKPCKMCAAETKRVFCSPACHDEHQRRNKRYVVCETCELVFTTSPSVTRKFCSIACRNNSTAWRTRSSVAANAAQNKKRGPNKLETAGNAILSALGIRFEAEFVVDGKFQVDAYLPDRRAVVQWDGDYWHGFDCSHPSPRQAKRMALDVSQDAYMQSIGLTVLRFWEHEVMRDPLSVAARLAQY